MNTYYGRYISAANLVRWSPFCHNLDIKVIAHNVTKPWRVRRTNSANTYSRHAMSSLNLPLFVRPPVSIPSPHTRITLI